MQIDKKPNMFGFGKAALAGTALAGFLLFAGVPRAQGNEAECQHRLARADHRLHEAVEHHGWDSRQAEHARHELREAREYCWSTSHRWWDVEGNRWHSDRDWDDDHGHR